MEFRQRFIRILRFTAITLAIGGLYIFLQELETEFSSLFTRSDWYFSWQESAWRREAEQLPKPNADEKATWPRHSRLLVWNIGILNGRAAQAQGSAFSSLPQNREKLLRLATKWIQLGDEGLTRDAGITPAPPLSFRTVDDALKLQTRIEKDENGMADLIARRFSAQHGYLYKLAMLVGMDETNSHLFKGEFFNPNPDLIGHNATLAGIPRELWQPLTQDPAKIGIPPEQRAAYYEGLIKQIGGYLAGQD